jgi:hypothetical protein
MTTSIDQLFNEIVATRPPLTLAQSAIALQLAKALAADQIDASQVSSLTAMLPPAQSGPARDLTRLSDDEFAALEYLLEVAEGNRPAALPALFRASKRRPPALSKRGYVAAI